MKRDVKEVIKFLWLVWRDLILAIVLLTGVFLRENTSLILSDITGIAPPGLYRIAGGLWEIVLAGIIILLVHTPNMVLERLIIVCACWVSISNSIMNVTCRILLPPPPYPVDQSQCDFLTNLPISAVSVGLQFAVIFFVVWRWRKNDN